MATMKLTLPSDTKICNGKQITFIAPCDSIDITEIQIKGDNYDLVDLRGNPLNSSNVFMRDALVTLLLDTFHKKAYLQGESSISKKDEGSIAITLRDNTFYKLTDVTSLTMKGTNVSCGGFIKFGTISSENLVVSGFAGSSGDDILASDVSNQLWEFSVAPSPIDGENGYIIWRNWSDAQ